MTDWYNMIWSEVVKELDSDGHKGLSDERVEEKRKDFGENKILLPKSKGLLGLIFNQIRQLWLFLLLLDLILFSIIGKYQVVFFLVIIILLSIIILVYGRYRDDKNLKVLVKYNVQPTNVIRNNKIITVMAQELVVGDIVVFNKGSVIPADMRIIESDELKIKETTVTGINSIEEKYETKIEERDINLSDIKNMTFKSSVVVEGSGTGIVTEVGMKTEIGKMVENLLVDEKDNTTFEKGIHEIMNALGQIALIGMIVSIVINVITKSALRQAISETALVIFSCIPATTVAIMYLITILVRKGLKKRDIDIKNLHVIQKLAAASIILTDKEQGLTEHKATIKKIYDTEEVRDTYIIDSITEGMDPASINENEVYEDNLRRILEVGLLCNDSKFEAGEENIGGDLIEVALIKFGLENSINKNSFERKYRRIFEIPYDTEKRIKTTVNKIEKKYRANVKGAVDVILSKCTHIMKNGIEREITEEDKRSITNADIEMSNEGLNVVGFAYRNFTYEPSPDENVESYLVFTGLVGFESPMKDEAIKALELSRSSAVKPVIVTEDSKLTAVAIGKRLGIVLNETDAISGIELQYMSDEELERNVERIGIYSRINSEHRRRIVAAFKKLGYNVVSSGSRLMDLPTLKISDVFISVGEKCNSIVKKISDVFFKENDLRKLLLLIENSRRIVNNLKKIVLYYYLSAVSEFVLILLAVLFRGVSPLNVDELIFINAINISISIMALFTEYKYGSFKRYDNSVIDKSLIKKNGISCVFYGTVIGVISFTAFWYFLNSNMMIAHSITFMVISIGQIIALYRDGWKKNFLFNIICFLNIVLQVSMVYTPAGKALFGLNLNNLSDYGTIMIFIIIEVIIFYFKSFLSSENNN
ncbi:MAG: cation-transporting P-type ATPase [Bacillota bacterium]|nr:cation-transporting P-type ATPase [Bacillota bacterium]